MELPRDAEIATARRPLALVGLVFLAIQLAAFSLERPPSWDEAIYLSQVSPDTEPLPFVASRARGITLFALPVLQLGGSLTILRLFLAVASAAALVGAFRLWSPVIGAGAVAAAVLFAGAWPTLFYGSELMPNLWLALLAVAATAILARRLGLRERRSDELVAGGLVAVAAMIRPLDATVLAATLVLLPVGLRRATWSWVGFLVLGLAAGWAPWLVEMTARFGSLGDAFAAAARLGHTGRWSLVENVEQYLALSDGPSIGPVAHPQVPVSGPLWLLGLVVLVVMGLREAHRRGFVRSLLVPVAAGAALGAEYVVFTDAQAPRFLLPAFALIAIPAGLGLASIVIASGARARGRPWRAAWAVIASALVGVWLIQQVVVATRIEEDVTAQRASAVRVGRQVRALAARQPCFVSSESSFPIVAYVARCRGSDLGEVLTSWEERAERLARDGVRPFLALRRARKQDAPAGAVLVRTVPSGGGFAWYVYERA
ncbi:MAG TPA: hypothetical protein VFZ75_05165 [Actinomycetota bacterium]|nr:hypothetical protein [Actinomycetota bacterium]